MANLPFISSSYQVPCIIFAYLYFVLGCGPRFMKNRPPYSLKTFIQVYNIVQIVANSWLVYKHIAYGIFSVKLVCPDFDYSENNTSAKLAKCTYYFFLLKLLDYVETGIFVLRKKNNQVSALHLYHHVSTLLLTWLGVRYYAVTAMTVVTIINSFIHAIMYMYYFLAACGPDIQKAVLPMKPWITKSQMIQFVILILYASQQFVIPNCTVVSNWVVLLFVVNVVINFFMFRNFYKKTYTKLKKT
ncbi:hypothetical protein PUN28_000105 [Cardiocondyla obscurior]